MNLPKRILSFAIAVGAIALVTAAPASASYDAWKPLENSVVTSYTTQITIWDEEPWGDHEGGSWVMYDSYLGKLGWNYKSFDTKISRCAGNEVKGEIEVQGSTSYYDAMLIRVRVNLYEGASCSTTDLDGQSPWRYVTLAPGEHAQVMIKVDNTAEGGDWVYGAVSLKASPVA